MPSANDIWLGVAIAGAILAIICTAIAITSAQVGAEYDKGRKQDEHDLYSSHSQGRSTKRRRG